MLPHVKWPLLYTRRGITLWQDSHPMTFNTDNIQSKDGLVDWEILKTWKLPSGLWTINSKTVSNLKLKRELQSIDEVKNKCFTSMLSRTSGSKTPLKKHANQKFMVLEMIFLLQSGCSLMLHHISPTSSFSWDNCQATRVRDAHQGQRRGQRLPLTLGPIRLLGGDGSSCHIVVHKWQTSVYVYNRIFQICTVKFVPGVIGFWVFWRHHF